MKRDVGLQSGAVGSRRFFLPAPNDRDAIFISFSPRNSVVSESRFGRSIVPTMKHVSCGFPKHSRSSKARHRVTQSQTPTELKIAACRRPILSSNRLLARELIERDSLFPGSPVRALWRVVKKSHGLVYLGLVLRFGNLVFEKRDAQNPRIEGLVSTVSLIWPRWRVTRIKRSFPVLEIQTMETDSQKVPV